MQNKKNILIMTQALSGGGAERLAANLSVGLKDKANITIVTYWATEDEYDYSGTRINLNMVGKSVLGKLLCSVRRVWAVHKIKKKHEIDISISYVPPCDYVNIFSKRKNEKTIIDVVSNMSKVYPKGLRRIFRQFILRKADFLVTDSEGVRQDLLNNFKINCEKKSRTIYSSLDISEIKRVCKEKNKVENLDLPQKFLSCMGSFRMAKGHWHLIKAFYTIKDKIPDIDLVIMGDGIYREKYNELISELGIEDRVYLPGYINPPHAVINLSEVFVFSSVYEGMGNSIIEAMACETPVVSVDCKFGAREILDPDTPIDHVCKKIEMCKYGIITPGFPMEDIDISRTITKEERMLGKGILEMLKDEKRKKNYIEMGIEYCNVFDNLEITRQWEDILDVVMKK